MSNEPEWKDVNPQTEDLSNKGKIIIQFIVGGLALCVLAAVGSINKTLGVGIGSFVFISGLMMLIRRRQFLYAPGILVAISGFFLMLSIVVKNVIFVTFPFGVGLIIVGLVKAINLAWDLGKFSK